MKKSLIVLLFATSALALQSCEIGGDQKETREKLDQASHNTRDTDIRLNNFSATISDPNLKEEFQIAQDQFISSRNNLVAYYKRQTDQHSILNSVHDNVAAGVDNLAPNHNILDIKLIYPNPPEKVIALLHRLSQKYQQAIPANGPNSKEPPQTVPAVLDF